MADALALAQLWADGLTAPDEHRDRVAAAMAHDVTTVTTLGTTEGKEAVVAAFGRSQLAPFIARGSWSEPTGDGNTATITCTFPSGAPVGGITVQLTADDANLIRRVETTMAPAAPVAPQPLIVTEAMKQAVDSALVSGTPVVVAYVDVDGQPHLSLRGTVQGYSDDQLAMWIRNPEGGLLTAIETNPKLALFYRNPGQRASYQFHGRAHAETDEATRNRVYDNSPEQERAIDAQRRGVAVVIDLDRIEGRDASGVIRMTRS